MVKRKKTMGEVEAGADEIDLEKNKDFPKTRLHKRKIKASALESNGNGAKHIEVEHEEEIPIIRAAMQKKINNITKALKPSEIYYYALIPFIKTQMEALEAAKPKATEKKKRKQSKKTKKEEMFEYERAEEETIAKDFTYFFSFPDQISKKKILRFPVTEDLLIALYRSNRENYVYLVRQKPLHFLSVAKKVIDDSEKKTFPHPDFLPRFSARWALIFLTTLRIPYAGYRICNAKIPKEFQPHYRNPLKEASKPVKSMTALPAESSLVQFDSHRPRSLLFPVPNVKPIPLGHDTFWEETPLFVACSSTHIDPSAIHFWIEKGANLNAWHYPPGRLFPSFSQQYKANIVEEIEEPEEKLNELPVNEQLIDGKAREQLADGDKQVSSSQDEKNEKSESKEENEDDDECNMLYVSSISSIISVAVLSGSIENVKAVLQHTSLNEDIVYYKIIPINPKKKVVDMRATPLLAMFQRIACLLRDRDPPMEIVMMCIDMILFLVKIMGKEEIARINEMYDTQNSAWSYSLNIWFLLHGVNECVAETTKKDIKNAIILFSGELLKFLITKFPVLHCQQEKGKHLLTLYAVSDVTHHLLKILIEELFKTKTQFMIDFPDARGQTALFVATQKGAALNVELLLQSNASPSIASATYAKGTPLKLPEYASDFRLPYDACFSDSSAASFEVYVNNLELIKAKVPDFNLSKVDPDGNTVLLRAMKNKTPGIDVKFVLDILPHLATVPDKYGNTPAIYAFRCSQNIGEVHSALCKLTEGNCLFDEVQPNPDPKDIPVAIGVSVFHSLFIFACLHPDLRGPIYGAVSKHHAKAATPLVNKQSNSSLKAVVASLLLLNSNENIQVLDTCFGCLVYHGAELNIPDIQGNTTLHYASYCEDANRLIFWCLIASAEIPPNANPQNKSGLTPLYYAANLKALLFLGADPYIKGDPEKAPGAMSVFEIVEALPTFKAELALHGFTDPDPQENRKINEAFFKKTKLEQLAKFEQCDDQAEAFLILKGIRVLPEDPTKDETFFSNNLVRVLKWILTTFTSNRYITKALSISLMKECERLKISFNALESPLTETGGKSLSVIKQLRYIRRRCDLTATLHSTWKIPLKCALLVMPTLILLHDITDYEDMSNDKLETPLIIALKYPWIANSGEMKIIVTHLLEAGAKIDHADCDGMTALMYAARNDHGAIVKALIEAGASINAKNKLGETPLHFMATHFNNASLLELMIEKGADPHALRADGTPVIMIATPDSAAAIYHCISKADQKTFAQAFPELLSKPINEVINFASLLLSSTKQIKSLYRVTEEDSPITKLEVALEEFLRQEKKNLPRLKRNLTLSTLGPEKLKAYLDTWCSVNRPLEFGYKFWEQEAPADSKELMARAEELTTSIKALDIGPPRTEEELKEASSSCSLVDVCKIISKDGYLLDAFLFTICIATSKPFTKWIHFQALKEGNVFGIYYIYGINEIGTGKVSDYSNFVDTEEDAIKLFEQEFKKFSGYSWADRAKIVPTNIYSPEGFVYIPLCPFVEQEHAEEQERAIDVNVSNLFTFLYKHTQLGMLGTEPINCWPSIKKTGVGPPLHYYLKEDYLHKAYQILEIIAKVILMRKETEPKSPESMQLRTNLAILSEYLFSLVPFHYPKQGLLEVLGKEDVEEKLALLQNLMEISIVGSLVSQRNSSLLKWERLYASLPVTLRYVEQDTDEFGFLSRQFIQLDLYKKLRILHAYDISRHDEEDHQRVYNNLSNRWLLYHGTTATAVLGIMRRGLQILKGHSAGYYGHGVYFADSPYKAIQYCGDSKVAVMLLCEVALGTVSKIQIDNLVYTNIKEELEQQGTHSLWAQGVNNVYGSHQMPNGASVPLIKINNAEAGRAWNEFVVYNAEQVKLKYLLIIERNGW